MPVDWTYAEDLIDLAGKGDYRIEGGDARRQTVTAAAIVDALRSQPGIVLADEVGMGKTYVALAVVASVLQSTRRARDPIVVMVPPALASKWPREWHQFKSTCTRQSGALDWVRDEFARTPTDFFKLLDDPPSERARLIWLTTSCFSLENLRDGWLKLALVRLARRHTRMDDETKKRFYKWAATLVRLGSQGLSPELVEKLMASDPLDWKRILVSWEILSEEDDDPVPEHLVRHADDLELDDLVRVVRGDALPGRRGAVSAARLNEARSDFNDACQTAYRSWLDRVRWHAPLIVLDEAHHAKNDRTQLATLFRTEDPRAFLEKRVEEAPRLWDKFDRMLFLTATPFQLGHHELTRILRSFAAARWSDARAPEGTRASFLDDLDELERRLNANRFAARQLDRLWGQLPPELLASADGDPVSAIEAWWEALRKRGDPDRVERDLIGAVDQCLRTKEFAERDSVRPRSALRTWVIRHNRPHLLPPRSGEPDRSRRVLRSGASIGGADENESRGGKGLELRGDGALPFLLAARAQSELASAESRARAFFAEGLCSSYEAFHHTREARGAARDSNDNEDAVADAEREALPVTSVVPVRWYEDQIGHLIPSREARPDERLAHPKLGPVVNRTLDLWMRGEKVLLFCFYRQTARALREHIGHEVERAILRLSAERLELEAGADDDAVRSVIASIARRLSDRDSPFFQALFGEEGVLQEPFARFPTLANRRSDLLQIVGAYVRSPSFIARYFPLGESSVRDALLGRSTTAAVAREAAEAVRRGVLEQRDTSGVTMIDRVEQLLAFAKELLERGGAPTDEGSGGRPDLLSTYLEALAVYSERSGAHSQDDDEDARGAPVAEGQYRVQATVRLVYGDTRQETRERLMLAFNSPLFPEILVSSAVLAEGVDLHRFCRHVIHHDLCWNPSTLEQRTGRVDRIRCKAELTGRPIVVYEPFLDGSADEKMFRVVRDRERWFQIVMGQKFEFDEGTTERLAARVPLPDSLASDLVFDLSRIHVEGR